MPLPTRLGGTVSLFTDYVEGPDGTLSPCETMLYDRLVELGGVTS